MTYINNEARARVAFAKLFEPKQEQTPQAPATCDKPAEKPVRKVFKVKR